MTTTTVAYPHLPAFVPTHWDIHGTANGYSSKWALYLIPAFMAGLIVLTWKLPWLSPTHFEVDSFRGTCAQLMLIVIGLLAFRDALIIWIGVGHVVSMRPVIFVSVCLIFMLIGNLMGKVRRNGNAREKRAYDPQQRIGQHNRITPEAKRP